MAGWGVTLRVAVVGTVAASLALVAQTPPAAAFVTGTVRVSVATAETSAAKSVTATCPAGTRVLSTGADVTPGNGLVLIDRIRPNAALTSVTVHAAEDELGTTDVWYVAAYVVCGAAPAGLELVTTTSTSSSSAAKTATASCAGGKKVVGAGAEVSGPSGQVVIDGVVPNAALKNVTVNALEDRTGTTAAWAATAYAICATPVAGLTRVAATSTASSTANKVVTVPCPAGAVLLGAMGSVSGADGQVVVDAVYQDQALTTAGFAAFEDRTGTSASWSLAVYGICASSATYIDASSTVSGNGLGLGDACVGRTAVGAGATIERARGRAGLTELYAWDDLNGSEGYRATAVSSNSGGATYQLTIHAVCTSPIAGIERLRVASASDNSQRKTVVATCPPGKRLVAAGLENFFTGSQLYLQEVRPNAALTSVTVTVGASELAGSDDWFFWARALCAPAPPGLQLVSATSDTTSLEANHAVAACPADKHVLGIGVALSPTANAQVFVNGVGFDQALDRVTATAYEDPTGYAGTWSTTAYAICVSR